MIGIEEEGRAKGRCEGGGDRGEDEADFDLGQVSIYHWIALVPRPYRLGGLRCGAGQRGRGRGARETG